MVVVVEPMGEGIQAGLVAGVGRDIGPFVFEGEVEPLDLPVGLGTVGPGTEMTDASRSQGLGEGMGAVTGAVEFLTGVKSGWMS
jgi:hypothetical protein